MTAATLSTLGLGVLLVGICLGVLLAHPHPIDKAAQRRRNEATLREVVNEVHANA